MYSSLILLNFGSSNSLFEITKILLELIFSRVCIIFSKLTSFSKELITFDELAGTIEADLEKGRSLGDKVEKFKEMTTKVNSSIATLKTLNNENIEYEKLDEVKAKLVRLDALTKNMIAAVNSSVAANNGSAIATAFLNINDIDKIARDLAAM